MSAHKKICCYKNCNTSSGSKGNEKTLFKFPDFKESERYAIWLKNSGLDSDANRNEQRYLCENHFSKRYIANQARRKMLVHTAVPMQQDEIETYNAGEAIEELYELLDEIENPPKIKSPSKTISNKLLTKSSEQRVLNKHASKGKPPSEKVPRRSFASQKKLVVSSNEINSSYDDPMDISNNIDDISTFVNTSNTPITVSVSNADARPTLPKILQVETVKLVQIQPTTPTTKIEPSETKIEKDSKLTEFIFMGEMYVQMPKSEYMAEKEKYMEKVDYYKNLLQELEAKIQNALKS